MAQAPSPFDEHMIYDTFKLEGRPYYITAADDTAPKTPQPDSAYTPMLNLRQWILDPHK